MKTTKRFAKRVTSVVLCLALLLACLPLSLFSVSAAPSDYVADPSTMDSWKLLFPKTGNLTTENAGRVWMDKSVLTDAGAFSGTGITKDKENGFLVALSTMASTISVEGMTNVPTDTMLVLDVSGSMNDGNNDVAAELVESANATIAELLKMSPDSRVGVVLYSGSSSGSHTTAATTLLPLNRYTTGTDGEYLTYTRNGWGDEYVGLSSNLRIDATPPTRPSTADTVKEVVGATYIQKGVIAAMNELVATDNSLAGTGGRKPIVVLMSDGAPTLSTTDFTAPGAHNLGNGQASSTSAAQGFVTQLSAAYAKNQIEAKYGTECLFYTLGLGVENDSVAVSVLDPANSSSAIDTFWTRYDALAVGGELQVGGSWRNPIEVTKINATLEQNYVDKYVGVEAGSTGLAQGLKDAFAEIVGMIQLQSRYYPTLISKSEDLDGYVSFVDRVGPYMNVVDVKGVLIHNTLFSGADIARTFENSPNLDPELVNAVQTRLGIADVATAEALIELAHNNKQLYWQDANNWSNYIGWYANAAGQFLGFYHEGLTELPAATGDAATDPAFVIRSYGYLGEVDEEHGVAKSDMMYTTVQVRENIATGEELVTFAVPAALIPLVTYEVTLDADGKLENLTAGGADHPIRLVYEVALDEAINPFTINDVVTDNDYLTDPHNVNADGSINFYASQWDHHNTTGYGTINTYSYFNPSRQNDIYYYTEDTVVYADTNGTPYTGTTQPTGTKYRRYTVYTKNGNTLSTEMHYRAMSADSLATASKNAGDNGWHITKGNVHVNLDGYTLYKGGTDVYDANNNPTGTLQYAAVPFVDTTNHSVNDTGYQFYVGATLGNNGRLSILPETGLKLTKAMADGVAAPNGAFTFTLENLTDATDDTTYPAYLVKVDGTTDDTVTVIFTDGKAAVSLKAGETLYVGGMTAGQQIRVTERDTVDYKVQSVNGVLGYDGVDVTLVENEMQNAAFVNTTRGKGNLTVAKEVLHDYGTAYEIPADKTFTINVTLSGIGTANATFEAKQTNSTLTSVTTDADGKFTAALKHDEQLELFGLPEGTVATVVEAAPGAGFTAQYYDNGVAGDGVVAVVANNTVSVIVVNDYEASPVTPPNMTVSGTKYLTYEDGSAVTDWGTAEFTVELQRHDGTDWVTVDTQVVNNANRVFTFDLSGERYEKAGSYSYRVRELVPATPIDGMFYDPTLHTFSVVVTDTDMNGQLEITRVYSEHAEKDFTQAGGMWLVQPDFNNVQYTTAPAALEIDVQKTLSNPSESPLVTLAGYRFGLYTDAACTTALTNAVDGVQSVNLPHTDALGESALEVVFDKTGTYTFYIKEINDGAAKMTYSEQVVKVTVTVVNGVGGHLQATAVYDTATNASNELVFNNVYAPDSAELAIDFVDKILDGRAMNAGEFTFEVREGNVTKLTGTNAAAAAGTAAAVTFNGTLKFDKVGLYSYTIVETGANANGVARDATVFRVMVTVTDVNGQLTADYALVNVVGDEAVFRNTYTATPVTHTVVGQKILTGRTLLNGEFTFDMTEVADAAGTPKAGAATYTAVNLANGSFRFDPITYTAAGTYYYEVSERAAVGNTHGVVYDTTKYIVTVKVKDTLLGALEIDGVTYAVKGGAAATGLTYNNRYVAAPVKDTIPGNKTLTGKVLGNGDYEFKLYKSDAAWTQGAEVETVKNAANGSFSFTEIEYTAAGTYYYLVKEVGGGTTVDGVTYDDTTFRVMVTVTDDHLGQLHSTTVVFDDADVPQSGIAFENVYAVSGDAQATLTVGKTLTGKALIDAAFTFELYEADSNLVIGTAPVQTATNVGSAATFTVTYDPDDVGKTFYYVLKEALPAGAVGGKLNGVTYDTTVYAATVKVNDDGDGTMSTEAPVYYKVNGNTLSAPVANVMFTNTYTASATDEITLSAKKTLTGTALTTQKFDFELYAATESAGAVTIGALLQSKQNSGENVVFDKLSYTSLAEVGTHHYLIKEKVPAGAVGNTLKGYTYDAKAYLATVVVEDNGDGTLAVTGPTYKEVNGGTVGATVALPNFTNTYAAKGDKSVVITATKTQTGKPLTTETFSFELYAATESAGVITAGALLQTKQNSGAAITFDAIEYLSVDEIGTHYYVVKELIPVAAAGNKLDGYTYDAKQYVVKVTVTDNGDGTLAVSDPTYYELGVNSTLGATVGAVAFKNHYEASAKDGAIISANKTQTGKPLTNEVYTFELYAATESAGKLTVGALLQTKNNSGATVTFDEIEYLALAEVGTHYYVIKEQVPTGAVGNKLGGVTYDTARFAAVVKVEDNGDGTLKVTGPTYYALDAEGALAGTTAQPNFENKYEAAAENGAIITAEKALLGKTLTTELFSFELYSAELKADGSIATLALLQTKQNSGAAVTFDEIEYLSLAEVGTHYYVVKEQIPTEAVDNKLGTITYDTAAYAVIVKVTDNGDGTLAVSAPEYHALGADGKPLSAIADKALFENKHTPAAIAVNLVGKKVLKKDGAAVTLDGKEFVFNLYDVTDNAETLLATVKNAADGSITFADLPIEKAGVTVYRIVEAASPYDDINVDATVYEVTVTVTDVDGTLVAETAITADGTAVEEVVFTNEYKPEPQPEPEPEPEPKPEPLPETGEADYLYLLFALMFVSGATLSAAAIFGKRKNEN